MFKADFPRSGNGKKTPIQIYYLVFLGLCAALSSLISSIFCIISSWCLTSGGSTSTFFFQMLERDRGRLKSPKNAFG